MGTCARWLRGKATRWLLVATLTASLVSAYAPFAGVASAAVTFTVNTTVDTVDAMPGDGVCADAGGNCSLRAAITETNALAGADTIIVPAGTYTLTIAGTGETASATGDLNIKGDLTIIGAGGNPDGNAADTIVQAGTTPSNGIDRVMGINVGGSGPLNVTIKAVTVRHGRTTIPGSTVGGGAGIYYAGGAAGGGNLYLYNVVVSDNTAGVALGAGVVLGNVSSTPIGVATIEKSTIANNNAMDNHGGGIYASNMALTIRDSTVSGNQSNRSTRPANGGGLYAINGATITVERSSFIGNRANNSVNDSANGHGGAIYTTTSAGAVTLESATFSSNYATQNGGAISFNSPSSLTAKNVTIANNQAGTAGGGVTKTGTTLVLHNSIVYGNTAPTGPDINGTVDTASYNIVGSIAGTSGIANGTNGNQVGVDPLLSSLGNYGGPTQTYKLLKGSPAMDAGTNAQAPTVDQRGLPRILDSADSDATATVDIGAVEAHPSISDIVDQTGTVGTPKPVPFYVGDASRGVTITATSSNQTVVPNTNLVMNNGSTYNPTLSVMGASTGTATITVTVTAGGDSMSDSFTMTVTGAPDLTIIGSHSPLHFIQGQQGNYTLTVSNVGNAPTSGTITVTDTLPAGMTAASFTGDVGWSCNTTTDPTKPSCTRASPLTPGTPSVLTLSVNVANNADTTVVHTNNAVVSGGGDSNSNNNQSNDSTSIDPGADLKITKSHTGDFTAGQSGTYTVKVQNVGGSPTSGGVTVTDTLPTGLTLVSMAGTGWTCTGNSCARSDILNPTFSYADIVVTVNVLPSAGNSVTNTASVSGGSDVNAGNDSANDTTNIIQYPDLTMTKSHSGNFRQGQTGAQYTMTVHNGGAAPTDGTAVTVAESVPTGLTLVSMRGTGWDCSAVTTCIRSDVLAAGADYPAITVTVDVANNAAASVANTASVAGGGEVLTNNNSATDPTTVNPAPDLTVTKSHSGSFTQGQNGATYTVTVTNASAGPTAGSVTVTESIPVGLSLVSMAGTGWDCTAGTSCTRSDALAGTSSYPAITVTVNVAANAPTPVTNTVSVVGGGELNTGNDSASDSTTISQLPELQMTKQHTGNFRQGETGKTYTLTVTNHGTGETSGPVTVTERVPTGLTLVSMSGTDWDCTAGTSCTRSDALAAGGSYPPITVTVNVAANAAAVVTNQADVAGGGDVNSTNNHVDDSTNITQAADLTLTKTHMGNFSKGQTGAHYTLIAHNSGTGPTDAAVTVTESVPTGLTLVSMSGTGWDCTGVTSCTRSDVLAAGADYPAITLSVDVAVDAPATITNTATVAGGGENNTANNSASDATTVVPESDLSITKSHTGDFTQGQAATYRILVHNGGGGATRGTATVTDHLPTGLTYAGFTGTNWSCTAAGQVVTCTSSDEVVPGADYPAISLTVSVGATVPPIITNEAEVAGGGELNTANNTCLDEAKVVQLVDLSIVKSHVGDFTQGQQNAAYTLAVTNNGIEPTSGSITVVDTLPTGLAYAGFTGTDWTCTAAGQTVTCTRSAALAPGAANATNIRVTVNVAATAAVSVTNLAAVSGGGDYSPANNHVSDITTVIQVGDLKVVKSHTGSFRQGRTGEYTLVVSNVGPGDTVGTVTMTDTLPVGMTATAMRGLGWTCDVAMVMCSRTDALAPGGSYSPITLTMQVAADAPPRVTNAAAVAGGGQINLANDTASDETAVVQVADLTLTKQHYGNFIRGLLGVYTLAVKNIGPGPTDERVTVTDTLPNGMTAIAMIGLGWTCDVATVTCTRTDALAPGGSYPTIALTVRVPGSPGPNLVNRAAVSGGGEAIVSNNAASDPTQVVAPPPEYVPTPPFVTITAPVAFTRESSVTVSGSATPSAQIKVNGTPVQVNASGTWSTAVALQEGVNLITATNGAASDSVRVTRDTTPPPITLAASQTQTDQETATLTATSEEGARVEIEGKPVSHLTVHLALGQNSFSATATDRAGNAARATVTVTRVRPGTPPPPGPTPPPPPKHRFEDVDGHWAGRAIERMVELGVVQGYEDNTFRPETRVSRLEFAVMVARLLKLTPAGQPVHFGDSDSIPDWARAEIAAAAQAGIITGRPDGSFDPNASVNRAEVAVMLVRAMNFRGMTVAPGSGHFADTLPAWAREQVLSAAKYGLMTGYADGSFQAENSATRGESATMLDRLWTLLSQK